MVMTWRLGLAVSLFAVLAGGSAHAVELNLPYREEGLSRQQAAAHLLERFAFGPRPGEVERVAGLGPAKWLARQLTGGLPDPGLDERLKVFPALSMTQAEIHEVYVSNGRLRRRMQSEGVLDPAGTSRAEMRRKMAQYREEHGLQPYHRLFNRELRGQKLVRAVHGEDQLAEVLTSFWFNHFNVTTRNRGARSRVLTYEREAIRPHVLGKFRTMLGATAKHPAMLYYLDNVRSRMAPPGRNRPVRGAAGGGTGLAGGMMAAAPAERPRKFGLNENYARELMELHTLGVDGGYTQRDVTEVARVLTGWGVMPYGERRTKIEQRIARGNRNLVQQGEFLFRKRWHDTGAKEVLGVTFPSGGGAAEGERVLDLLAEHPSTARFIATKLARRFVSDHPPEALVARLAGTFARTGGDLAAVMATLAQSRAFWAEARTRGKIKSPFELVASSLRALDADVRRSRPVMQWLERMGQPLYGYTPPTGHPDYAASWMNSGALIARINFGVHLAGGRIRGISLKRLPKRRRRDVMTTDKALAVYGALLLPARDTREIASEVRKTIPRDAERKDMKVAGMLLASPEFQYR